MKHNWSAAFVAYCQNHPFEEISIEFGIPMGSLKSVAAEQRWQQLREQLPVAQAEAAATEGLTGTIANPFERSPQGQPLQTVPKSLPLALRAKFEKLAENRAKNYNQAAQMRDHLTALLGKLLSGELKLEQLFHNKGTVVRTTRDLSPADLVNLATFARLVQEMTYRALGDVSATEKGSQDAPVGVNLPQAPAIIINLPGAIAKPRDQRKMLDAAERAGAKVIDLEAAVVETAPVEEHKEKIIGEAPDAPV